MYEQSRILVIDDSRTMFEMIKYSLKSGGFTLLDHARDNFTGMDFLTNNSYEVIILDIGLPGMNGIEIAQEILKTKPDQKILILTALKGEHYKEMVSNLGITNFMYKPFKSIQLVDEIKSIINKK